MQYHMVSKSDFVKKCHLDPFASEPTITIIEFLLIYSSKMTFEANGT